MEEKKKPFLTRLRELQVGESIEEPISRRSYIAMASTRFGVEWDTKFTIKSNREERKVTITRTL
jgi:hypothetical protein